MKIISKNSLIATLFVGVILLINRSLHADNTITLQLNPAPLNILNEVREILQKEDVLIPKIPLSLSFTATYGGYMSTSNEQGIITFPLRHPDKKVSIAITEGFKPIIFEGNTISHIIFNKPTKMYSFEKVEEKLNQKDISYWNVTEEQVTLNKRYEPTTIVIHADIRNIFVKVGKHLIMDKNIQIVLPQVFYVVGNINNTLNQLNILDIQWLFEHINIAQKKNNTNVQRRITNL